MVCAFKHSMVYYHWRERRPWDLLQSRATTKEFRHPGNNQHNPFTRRGTLAEKGMVLLALHTALEQLRAAGYALFMVTGRRFGDAGPSPSGDVCTGIIWENGAVLHHTTTDKVYLPFGHVEPNLVKALELAQALLEHERATVSTWKPHDETVWQVLNDWGATPWSRTTRV
jgi:hypothetical protein